MKRGGPTHPKTNALARRLGVTRYEAVGVLECLFHWAGSYARRGDIGRFAPSDIADGIGWLGDPQQLVDALIETKWLDRCRCHGLRIHGWPEHADQAVRKTRDVTSQGFLECYESSGDTPSSEVEGFRKSEPWDADSRLTTHDSRNRTHDSRQPADPVLDRSRLTERWSELIPAVSGLADLDPSEVARKVTAYKGHSQVNPANMTPERLAHAVAALAKWHRELTGRPEPEMPTPVAQPPPREPRTVAERSMSALEQFAGQRGLHVGSGPGSGGAGNVVRGGPDEARRSLPSGGGPADPKRVRGGDG